MYEKFYEEHKYNMIKDFNQTTLDNPVTDIIDSYYICKEDMFTAIITYYRIKYIICRRHVFDIRLMRFFSSAAIAVLVIRTVLEVAN
nr:MAG: hypothetical protein CM15mV30_0210 [uncultured marine virus]